MSTSSHLVKPPVPPNHSRITVSQPAQPEQRPKMTDDARQRPAALMRAVGLNFFYGKHQALFDVSMEIQATRITALIGPSGCGKSTFLRVFNRMNETVKGSRVEGQILFGDRDVRWLDLVNVRRKIGMVFQKPNPFPKSVFENVAYGIRINRLARGYGIAERVEESLTRAALWDEVKDKLHDSALALS